MPADFRHIDSNFDVGSSLAAVVSGLDTWSTMMDWTHDLHNHFRSISDWWSVSAAYLGVIRDENGEIRWKAILSSVMAAAIIGGGAAFVDLRSQVDRMRGSFDIWATSRADLPLATVRIETRVDEILKRMDRVREDQDRRFKELENRLDRIERQRSQSGRGM